MAYRGPLPTKLRRILVADLPEADYAKTQATPSASICVDVTRLNKIAITFVPRKVDETVSTGTVDLQLIDIANIVDSDGETTDTNLIRSASIDLAVEVGEGLTYDVSRSRLVTVRIAGNALGGDATAVDIYWSEV